ncbi:MAG: alpha/beta hydrolase, partial [Halanaerobium sp.]|nr:alpha/beta hydrolase [Halanaerobium sp.]
PTLVLAAEKDILKPEDYSKIIAGRIPGADLQVVPDAGHALPLEKPEVFNQILMDFLASQKD